MPGPSGRTTTYGDAMHEETREFILTVIRDVINLPLPAQVEDGLPSARKGWGSSRSP